jgi:DNA-binding NarL/FixJ family response regulator
LPGSTDMSMTQQPTIRPNVPITPPKESPSAQTGSTGHGPLANGIAPHHDLPAPKTRTVVLIEERRLIRETLSQCLNTVPGIDLRLSASVGEWLKHADERRANIVLYSIAGRPMDEANRANIRRIAQSCPQSPLILLCDSEGLDEIMGALEDGARGYIPTSLSLNIIAEAMGLVAAGGVYLPLSSLSAARRAGNETTSRPVRPGAEIFTARQLEVLEALRMGKANKIIAYELEMCESTVKVHVRNIMKKLSATNRTEVAYKAGKLLGDGGAF